MRMHRVTREELKAMNREGLRCAAELADARVDVTNTACLVAIMAMGPGYHCKTTITDRGRHASIIGAKRIALLAPYMCARCDLVVQYIENESVEVGDSIAVEIRDNLEVGRIDPMRPGDAESARLHLFAMRRQLDSEEPQYRL
jgi:maleate isomerase